MSRDETVHTPLTDMKEESAAKGSDPKTRMILIVLLVLWLITLAALVGVGWKAYFSEKNKSQTLAQQIALACETGALGSEFSDEDEEALCSNAEKVIEQQGEIQDEEIQESEEQEPEIQESELQEPERQDAERQDPENQDPEIGNPEEQDPEAQDPEVDDPDANDPDPNDPENQENEVQDEEKQDDEVQDPEIQDDEVQDPEVDDPDPASPFVFTFTFTVSGNGVNPDQTYTVACNSGTGACTVTPS